MRKNFKFFSGSSNLVLARKVAKLLGVSLAKAEIYRFSNNEIRVRIEEDVKNQTCIILQSLSTPSDKNWVELLFFLDALKRSGAKKIIGVIPWLGYQKQDKQFRSGEVVSVAVVIKTLEALGMDTMITFDLHSPIISTYFQNPPVTLSAFPLFLEEIKKLVGKKNDKFVMVAPDKGAYWAKEISRKLSISLAQVAKERDKQTAEIAFESLKIKGEVQGKTALIVDDNIYTGSTLIHNAKLLKKTGATGVICFVTHPVLSGNAPALIQASEIDRLMVTDTIFVPTKKIFPKLAIISIAQPLAEAIRKMV